MHAPRHLRSSVAAIALLLASACGSDAGTDASATTPNVIDTTTSPPSDEPEVSATDPSTVDSTTSLASVEPDVDPPCGVTLAEIQRLLGGYSGVTENTTPDPGRCNFTWDDGGPRGIDAAIVAGARASFAVPDGYEPLDGYGDEAYLSTQPGRASAFAFVGDDLYAADVVADGATDDLQALCLEVLALTLS